MINIKNIMPYSHQLGNGQTIYLDNSGSQTIITTVSSSMGQQQQSSCSFNTGNWTKPPEMLQNPAGIVVKINSVSGEHLISVQGNSMSLMSTNASVGGGQQLQLQQVTQTPPHSIPSMEPMQPMQPMKPMKMGDMSMNTNPMEMRMGNMEMRMDSTSTSSQSKRFCSQCGAPIKASDRFCSSCGHRLED